MTDLKNNNAINQIEINAIIENFTNFTKNYNNDLFKVDLNSYNLDELYKFLNKAILFKNFAEIYCDCSYKSVEYNRLKELNYITVDIFNYIILRTFKLYGKFYYTEKDYIVTDDKNIKAFFNPFSVSLKKIDRILTIEISEGLCSYGIGLRVFYMDYIDTFDTELFKYYDRLIFKDDIEKSLNILKFCYNFDKMEFLNKFLEY